MLNYIWAAMIILSAIFGFANGRVTQLSASITDGASGAVEIFFILLAMLVFWSGIMKIADSCGITAFTARLLNPLIGLLFKAERYNPAAKKAIAMNISANMLGLGNAATPFGLEAMKQLERVNPSPKTASDSMIMFVVINTVSVQLVPTGVITLRAAAGAQSPAAVIPAVLIASFCSALFGVLLTVLIRSFTKSSGR